MHRSPAVLFELIKKKEVLINSETTYKPLKLHRILLAVQILILQGRAGTEPCAEALHGVQQAPVEYKMPKRKTSWT